MAHHPPSGYVTKDSGQRDDFSTGARRDVQTGKPRYELLPVQWLKALALRIDEGNPDERLDLIPIEPLFRHAALKGRGARKYGENNWQLGMPFKRCMASLLRHAFQYLEGDRSEDHLAAVAFGAYILMAYEDMIAKGLLPKELDDITEKTSGS